MTHDPYALPQADSLAATNLAHPGVRPLSAAEYESIRQRLQAMNRTSLLLGGPGLALQAVGNFTPGIAGALASLGGVGLLIAGLSKYARMRGHSPWYGALGLLSCLGMLILVLLPKKCFNCGASAKGATCAACGAPAPP